MWVSCVCVSKLGKWCVRKWRVGKLCLCVCKLCV